MCRQVAELRVLDEQQRMADLWYQDEQRKLMVRYQQQCDPMANARQGILVQSLAAVQPLQCGGGAGAGRGATSSAWLLVHSVYEFWHGLTPYSIGER